MRVDMVATIARVATLLLAVTFAWASIAKLLRWTRWRDAVARYRLGGAALTTEFAVPAVEAGVAALLLWGDARVGAAASLSLVSIFSLAVLRARAQEGDSLPCGCFGGATERDYRHMLVRNASIAALAALVLAQPPDLQSPSTEEALPAALTLLGACGIAWLAHHASASLLRR
jgi:hypothetical protein